MGSEFIVPVGSVIKEYLEEYNISQKELADRLGMSEKQVSKFMTAKSRLTEDVAIKLEKIIPGVKAGYWLNYESKYREYQARLKSEQKLLDKDLKKISERFHFKEVYKDTELDLVAQAQEMLKLLKIADFDMFENVYGNFAADFMEDGGNPEAIAVWLNLCEEEIELQNDDLSEQVYSQKELNKKMPMFRALALSEDATALTKNCRKLCNKLGIYLVFEKPIQNCKVRGALTTYKKHPAIYLSGRFKTHDHIWFAFMHEIGHLCLHYDSKSLMVSYEDTVMSDCREKEANTFAREFFIPEEKITAYLREQKESDNPFSEASIRLFAKKLKIHPGIVVARLQHDKIIENSRMNHLKCKIEI